MRPVQAGRAPEGPPPIIGSLTKTTETAPPWSRVLSHADGILLRSAMGRAQRLLLFGAVGSSVPSGSGAQQQPLELPPPACRGCSADEECRVALPQQNCSWTRPAVMCTAHGRLHCWDSGAWAAVGPAEPVAACCVGWGSEVHAAVSGEAVTMARSSFCRGAAAASAQQKEQEEQQQEGGCTR